jgi:hypothetical protein
MAVNEPVNSPRAITLTLPSWPVLAVGVALVLGLGAGVAGGVGWWVWSSWQEAERLQAARAEYPRHFAALAVPMEQGLAQVESAALKLSGETSAALSAVRAASIVPARMESDAVLVRRDAAALRARLGELQGLEASVRISSGVADGAALAGPGEAARLQDFVRRVEAVERSLPEIEARMVQARERREHLVAQAAAAERERRAAVARAQAEARAAAARREIWVQPRYTQPAVVVAPSWGWHAAHAPVWGYRHRSYSHPGYGCGPVRRHRPGASVGVSFVFR